MPDSGDVDVALVTKLGSDATLLALMPNGVYWDEAPANMTRFVIVSLVDEDDEPMFNTRAFESALYFVEARALGASVPDIKTAAARIDTLLDNQPLTVTGYSHMMTRREKRIRTVEVDDRDESIRWQRRGGYYRVVVSG